MNRTARELYEAYAGAVVYVEVARPDGDRGIGTAFHVGDNVFITARHLVDGNTVTEVGTTMKRYVPDPEGNLRISNQEGLFRGVKPQVGRLVRGPLYHPDQTVDVAAIVVEGLDVETIPLGSHLDEWIHDETFILAETIVLGYPPIPMAKKPTLVTARAEVSAVIDKYTGGHPYFIVSCMARGGFSGGPCLSTWDFALGMVVESLVENNQSEQLGFLAVITVEPIIVCLVHHEIVPKAQVEWTGLLIGKEDDLTTDIAKLGEKGYRVMITVLSNGDWVALPVPRGQRIVPPKQH